MSAERTIGNYVLGPLLGRGGMSEVHAAAHRFLGDRVAIKLLRSQLAADAAATAAFVAEATRTRAIDHPGVVRVLDFGSDGAAFYLVMERLDGESLAARLARAGRLDEPEVRRLGAAIADGLAAAHDRGIVHRDLKPGNIVLVGDQPKIIDFGIAREVAAATTGSRLGTIAYMAPEQLTGGVVAPCVDIWALGVLLYEAVAGRLPFDGFAAGRTPQLFEAAPPLGGVAPVSPALASLIAGCLERDLTRRPPSMRAIAEALRGTGEEPRITEDVAPAAGQAGARGAGPSDDRTNAGSGADRSTSADRRPRRRIAGSIAALAIAVGGVAGVLRLRGAEDREAPSSATGGGGTAAAAAVAVPSSDPAANPPAVAAAIAPVPAAGFTVEVRSAPPGAQVLVRGKRVGITPATIALDGPASIVVTRAGYRPSRVRAERAGEIDVRLTPAHRPPSRGPAAGETLD
jgi:hypothetical protein